MKAENKSAFILSVIVPIVLYIFTAMLFMVLQPLCIQQQPIGKESLLPHTSLDLEKIFGYSAIPVGAALLLFTLIY